MVPQSLLISARAIAAARRGQAIRHLIFYWGFFCLTLSSALAQNINPEAQRLFRQADTSADPNQKIRLLESAVRLSPQYIEARLELAKTLIQSQQFRRAIFQLDTVLSTNSKNAEAWFYKAHAHAELGENNTARKSFAQALVIYLELGKSQFASKSFDAALQSFQQGITSAISTQDNPRQAEAWFGKGRAHEAQGDTANAARSYRQCLSVQPDFKAARSALSNLENQTKLQARASVDSAKVVPKFDKLDSTTISGKTPATTSKEDKLALRQSREQTPPPKPFAPEEKKAQRPDSIPAETLSIKVKPPDSLKNNQPQISVSEKLWQILWVRWAIIISITALFAVFFILLYRNYKRSTKSEAEKPSKPVLIETEFLRQKLPRYRIERRLGEGGQANVYKALDLKLGRKVALKTIRFEPAMPREEIEERKIRFIEEAKKIAQLNQPNIVGIFDYEKIDEVLLYMAMEFVEGFSVQQMIRQKSRLALDEAVDIIAQSCRALDHAHRNGIIHRDIKPSNIMVNIEGVVKVVDFGIAKMLDSTKSQVNTMTGMLVGTPSYMSPEQIEAGTTPKRNQDDPSGKLDGRTDIFSLGIVFYEMLAGENPFAATAGNSYRKVLQNILTEDPLKLSLKRPEVTPRLETIVETMLAKNPAQRFQTAKEIIEALKPLGATV